MRGMRGPGANARGRASVNGDPLCDGTACTRVPEHQGARVQGQIWKVRPLPGQQAGLSDGEEEEEEGEAAGRKRQELRGTSGTEEATSAAQSLPSREEPRRNAIPGAKLCKENRGNAKGTWRDSGGKWRHGGAAPPKS